jgi:hypothetical protein
MTLPNIFTKNKEKANDYPQSKPLLKKQTITSQSKPLLLRQSAATPKTRKTRPENDSGAGCFMRQKAQNPLKSRSFRRKRKADFCGNTHKISEDGTIKFPNPLGFIRVLRIIPTLKIPF